MDGSPLRLRTVVRTLLVALAVVLTAPAWLIVRLSQSIFHTDTLFVSWSQALSLIPGRTGVYLRRGFYRMTLDQFATDCQVEFGTTFSHSKVVIHPHVVIGKNCTIGRVILEEGVALGSNVDILSGRHHHISADTEMPVQYQTGHFTQIRIGKNSWIGNSTVIMADIGQGSVIGAGTVVVKPIPDRVVAVGNPAVVKKSLTPRYAA